MQAYLLGSSLSEIGPSVQLLPSMVAILSSTDCLWDIEKDSKVRDDKRENHKGP